MHSSWNHPFCNGMKWMQFWNVAWKKFEHIIHSFFKHYTTCSTSTKYLTCDSVFDTCLRAHMPSRDSSLWGPMTSRRVSNPEFLGRGQHFLNLVTKYEFWAQSLLKPNHTRAQWRVLSISRFSWSEDFMLLWNIGILCPQERACLVRKWGVRPSNSSYKRFHL